MTSGTQCAGPSSFKTPDILIGQCARKHAQGGDGMAMVNGSQILARALRKLEIDTMFYLMGGPMLAAESACIEEGIRSIDVRHEQAAAMMAHAYGRVLNRIGVCMAAS